MQYNYINKDNLIQWISKKKINITNLELIYGINFYQSINNIIIGNTQNKKFSDNSISSISISWIIFSSFTKINIVQIIQLTSK